MKQFKMKFYLLKGIKTLKIIFKGSFLMLQPIELEKMAEQSSKFGCKLQCQCILRKSLLNTGYSAEMSADGKMTTGPPDLVQI